jgi:hypothetical protein
LVELIFGESATVYPFDIVTVGADAQTVLKTGASAGNRIGIVDTSYGAAGKAMVSGDPILVWLKPNALWSSH